MSIGNEGNDKPSAYCTRNMDDRFQLFIFCWRHPHAVMDPCLTGIGQLIIINIYPSYLRNKPHFLPLLI